jgi:hypothetical protein
MLIIGVETPRPGSSPFLKQAVWDLIMLPAHLGIALESQSARAIPLEMAR